MSAAVTPIPDATRRAGASRSWFMPALYAGLTVALMAALLWSIASGRFAVPFGKVIAILLAPLTGDAVTWTPTEAIVVNVVRLPRLLTAAVAGASL
jgi:iron complex transport system permease protein